MVLIIFTELLTLRCIVNLLGLLHSLIPGESGPAYAQDCDYYRENEMQQHSKHKCLLKG